MSANRIDSLIFDEGCTARLNGRPASNNPYQPPTGNEAASWEHGWNEVHRFYGQYVRGRWSVTPLLPIQKADARRSA